MSKEHQRIRFNPEVRKRQLLQVALDLFTEQGFETVDMAMIAERAQVARPTVYKYFASTEVMLAQLLETGLETVWADLQPVVSAPDIGCEQSYQALFKVLLQHPQLLKLLHSGGGPIFRKYQHQLFFERLAQHLDLPVRPNNHPYQWLVVSVLLEGLAYWAVVNPTLDREQLSQTLAATLAIQTVSPST